MVGCHGNILSSVVKYKKCDYDKHMSLYGMKLAGFNLGPDSREKEN